MYIVIAPFSAVLQETSEADVYQPAVHGRKMLPAIGLDKAQTRDCLNLEMLHVLYGVAAQKWMSVAHKIKFSTPSQIAKRPTFVAGLFVGGVHNCDPKCRSIIFSWVVVFGLPGPDP